MLKKVAVSLLAIAAFAVFSSVNAEMNLGFKGGINLAKVWGAEEEAGSDPYEYQVPLPGAVAGVYAEIIAVPMFAVQPEVLFSMKGTKEENEGYVEVLRFNYLEVPILLKPRFAFGSVVPSIFTGVSFAFRLGVNGYEEAGEERFDYTEEDIEYMKEATKAFDIGLPMGVALDIGTGPINIVADVRYTLGLMGVEKLTEEMEELGATEDDLDGHKNGAFSIMAGISIPLGS